MSSAMYERQEQMFQRPKSTLTMIAILVAFFVFFCGHSDQFGMQSRLITRFCYNSPNLSTINSQCVLCNYYLFDSTLLGCTGSTALNVNITASQAFCVISQCLGQVRQSPVFLGRRKRGLLAQDGDNDVDMEEVDSTAEHLTGNWSSGGRFAVVKQVDAEVFFEGD